MFKLIAALALLTSIMGCVYNPTQYEEMRQRENAEHDRQGY